MKTIRVDRAEHVAEVTLTSQTMPPVFFEELGEVFRSLSGQSDLRAVVLVGSGKAFSYGLDLRAAFQELGPTLAGGGLAGSRSELLALIRRWQGHVEAVATCPVPVLAAVHGWCVGGGLDLISACDIRLASEDARFSLRETRIAIVADLGSLQRLPPIIGEGATRELAFTGKDIDAQKARRMGLVNDVLPDRDALLEAAREMALQIAANAPLTVRGVKNVLDFGRGKPAADGLAYVATWNSAFLASEDLGEALAAFTEKREPHFKGR